MNAVVWVGPDDANDDAVIAAEMAHLLYKATRDTYDVRVHRSGHLLERVLVLLVR